MKVIGLIEQSKPIQTPLYEYKVSFFPDNYYALYIVDGYLVFYGHKTTKAGLFLADQLEIPLAAVDFILATIARYDLPSKLGGLGGLNNSAETIIKGEKIYFDKTIHPHYGIETYSITNFNRRSHIDGDLNQDKTIFKETMDAGLLEKLIDINKNYHDGAYA